jgi:hypothetical protein
LAGLFGLGKSVHNSIKAEKKLAEAVKSDARLEQIWAFEQERGEFDYDEEADKLYLRIRLVNDNYYQDYGY